MHILCYAYENSVMLVCLITPQEGFNRHSGEKFSLGTDMSQMPTYAFFRMMKRSIIVNRVAKEFEAEGFVKNNNEKGNKLLL